MDTPNNGGIAKAGPALIAQTTREVVAQKVLKRQIEERSRYFAALLVRIAQTLIFPSSQDVDYLELSRDDLLFLEQEVTKIALADRWWRNLGDQYRKYLLKSYLSDRHFLVENLGSDWFPEEYVREYIRLAANNLLSSSTICQWLKPDLCYFD